MRSYHEGTKDTKIKLKKINHKGHKELKGRDARKINFLRPLRSLRLNHPKGDSYSRPLICDLCALCG